MKKLTTFFWAFLLSNSVLAENLDVIVKSVKEVCEQPSQQGTYWNASGKGDVKAGMVRVIAVGVNGEANFTKTEWEGVKDVLANNKDYRSCAVQLTPIFLEKFSPKTATKSANSNKTKSAKKENSAKSTHTKPSEIHQESTGGIAPNIVSDGDVTINVNQK
jgi:hypothetical protein